MKTILLTIAVALVLSFLLGMLLGLFKKIFAVRTDPKVLAIQAELSGGNCGGCGYAGCAAFAEAVVRGEAPANGCVAGGPSVAKKIAELLGVEVSAVKKAALLTCQGTKDCALPRGTYSGVQTCAAAVQSVNGTKLCAYGCAGLGDCVASCPFGALSMGEDGLPHVDYAKCVGCGKCARACPKKLFTIVDAGTKGAVALCANRSDNRPPIKKNCSKGCIKCGICEKKCPEHCIVVTNGIPVVDYATCTSCGTCVTACPDKVLVLQQDVVTVNA